jgi:hypothetical protein
MGIIFLDIIPTLYIWWALIVETDIQVGSAPSEAVTERKRGNFPQFHHLAAVAAQRFFLRQNFF